jgi:hypothetical protein
MAAARVLCLSFILIAITNEVACWIEALAVLYGDIDSVAPIFSVLFLPKGKM